MVKAGTWGKDSSQLHRFFAWKDINLHGEAPYRIEAPDCPVCETTLKDSVTITPEEATAHPEWLYGIGETTRDLTMNKQIAFNM